MAPGGLVDRLGPLGEARSRTGRDRCARGPAPAARRPGRGIKVPQRGAADDLVPGADARQRRVDDNPVHHPRGILRGERIADHVADVVRDQRGAIDLQSVHDARDVAGLRLLVIAARRMRRQTDAAQIGNNNGAIFPSAAATGAHMSPVSPKPCSMTTAGPWPPIRTWMVAPSVLTFRVRKLRGNDWTKTKTRNATGGASISPQNAAAGKAIMPAHVTYST